MSDSDVPAVNLSPAELRALTVLALLGEPVARTEWQRRASDAGVGEAYTGKFTPDAFRRMCERFVESDLVYDPTPDRTYTRYFLHLEDALRVLELAQRDGLLDSVFASLYPTERWGHRHGYNTRRMVSARLQMACVRGKPKELTNAVVAVLAYTHPRDRGVVLLQHFGLRPRPAWLEALQDDAREAYMRTALSCAFDDLFVPSESLLQAGLASAKRDTALIAARLMVLLGRLDELESQAAYKKRTATDQLGMRLVAAFFDGRFAAARELGDEAVKTMRKRKFAQLRDLEGVLHAMVCAAHNDHAGAWQTAVDMVANAEAAKAGYAGAFGVLALFMRHVGQPGGDSSALHEAGLLSGYVSTWVDQLAFSTVNAWLGLAAKKRVSSELAVWEARAGAGGYEGVSRTLGGLARGGLGAPDGIGAAYRRREAWELALDSLAALGDTVPDEPTVRTRDEREVVWVLDLVKPPPRERLVRSDEDDEDDEDDVFDVDDEFDEEEMEALDVVADATERAANIEETTALWAPGNHFHNLPLEPRLVGKVKGGRGKSISLTKLAGGKVPEVDRHDLSVIATMHDGYDGWRRGSAKKVFPISALAALVGHPRVVTPDGEALVVERRRPTIEVVHAELPSAAGGPGSTPRTAKKTDDSKTNQQHTFAVLRMRPAALATCQIVVDQRTPGRLLVYRRTPNVERILAALGSHELRVPEAGFASLSRALASLGGGAVSEDVDLDLDRTAESDGLGDIVEPDSGAMARLFWNGRRLSAQIRVAPLGIDGPHVRPGHGATLLLGRIDGKMLKTSRDLEAESAGQAAVFAACPMLETLPLEEELYIAEDLESALGVLVELGMALGEGRLVWPEKRRLSVSRTAGANVLRAKVRESGYWLNCEATVAVDESTVFDLQTLLRARKGGGRFVQIREDEYVALTADLKRRLDGLENLGTAKSKGLSIAPVLLPTLAELFEDAGEIAFNPAAKARMSRLDAAAELRPRVPRGFAGSLRDYQREGFVWLSRLAEAGLGAVLADDMGLGKTVQALALLCQRGKAGPALVVAPASVIHNWSDETNRFAPSLRPILLGQGDRSALLSSLGPRDILICSYGVLAREAEALAETAFGTIIFDEAHALKNANTQRAKAAFGLNGGFRLGLTGTPIENHLGELWSVMQAVVPGLLGSAAHFGRRFVKPIGDGDRERARQLRALVRPFMLRRTKAQVLDELPERTEITIRVTPDDDERTYYEALRRNALDNLQAPGKLGQKARMRLLAEITKLRQAAVSPSLVDAELGPTGAKIDLLVDRLVSLGQEGHRALVFTQFLGAMEMIRKRLDKLDISHLSLDGATPTAERAKRIEAFQDGQADVFIMSLKAGGVGINLTAADYVIHLDPWWNPATEDQAIGRAHRIGQTRPVTVYRLIQEGSIEERIVALHRSKRALAEDLLAGMETSKALDVEALRALIEG